MRTLDVKELKRLCENVIRDIGKDEDLPIAKDWGWARLTHESLPDIEEFFRNREKLGMSINV